jgi:hypothetical protein
VLRFFSFLAKFLCFFYNINFIYTVYIFNIKKLKRQKKNNKTNKIV